MVSVWKTSRISKCESQMVKATSPLLLQLLATLLVAWGGLSGCTTVASPPPGFDESGVSPQHTAKPQTAAQRGLAIARSMVGAPYRYGGADPRGFDCSGLVYYSYGKAGVEIARTTTGQYRQSRRVPLSRLRPGDLLFFTISREKPSHVGIYAGNGAFIHAPSSGKSVGYASLKNDYWRSRLVASGRL